MKNDSENITYYEENYHILTFQHNDKVLYIPTNNEYVCRFCGLDKSKTSFKKIAHAIPELLGNKYLRSKNECDVCNQELGKDLEDNLAKFLLPYRSIAGIQGKNGAPTYKDSNTRIKNTENTINLDSTPKNFIIDEESKKLMLNLQTQPLTPIKVYKAFLKMALSLMPEELLPDYEKISNFVKNKELLDFPKAFARIGVTSTSGNFPYVTPSPLLLIRKDDEKLIPFMYLVLIFGNYIFQLYIPSKIKDKKLFEQNKTIKWRSFPSLYSIGPNPKGLKSKFGFIDLSGKTPVIGKSEYVMNYKEISRSQIS